MHGMAHGLARRVEIDTVALRMIASRYGSGFLNDKYS